MFVRMRVTVHPDILNTANTECCVCVCVCVCVCMYAPWHEQVDKHAREQLTSNPKLIENMFNVARLVPTGDAGYKTDAF